MNELLRHKKFDHDEYAKTRPRDDFWGQIRRTVNGKPVSEAQIRLIVEAICTALKMKHADVILDLACGNGALSHLLFNSCAEIVGVDMSEFLISIAKENFETLPNLSFVHNNAVEFVRQEKEPEKYSKVLCYGSFQYFPEADAVEVLSLLFKNFNNVEYVFIGNLPDKEQANQFYKDSVPSEDELADCFSQIGKWRTQDEFLTLASNAGWKVTFSKMPSQFYAASYRYDALLSR